MQTKKESIGYILVAALHTDVPSNLLKEIASAALSIVNEELEIDNWRTLDFAETIGKRIGLSEKLIETLKSELYYQFDMKTEGEAGQYYDHFSNLFYVLKKE